MKKIFFFLVVQFVFLNSFCSSLSADFNISTPSVTYDTIFSNNPNFQYIGRIDFSDAKKPLFACANTIIKTKFQGTSVTMLLKQYAGSSFSENSFYAIVDNGTPLKIIATTSNLNYLIASNLANTIHSLEIIKITEAFCGYCQFLGLLVDRGKATETPNALPSLKLEFYGASSTGGYGIEGGARPGSDNSYKADPAVCARNLNAQLNIISLSGYGMAVGWAGTIGSIWDKVIPVPSTPAPTNNTWDFTKYIPDVVVIELGTNDYNAPGGLTGALTVSQYSTVYKDFISKIRGKYPSAKIVCTNSYMLPDPGFSVITDAVRTVVADVRSGGDNKVFYFGFPKMIGGGYNGHPGVTDGTNNGTLMANYIRNTVLPAPNTSVNKTSDERALVYYNRNNKELHIVNPSKCLNSTITIYSVDGKELYSKKTNEQELRIKSSDLNVNGVIVVKLFAEGQTSIYKSIIQ